MAAVSGLVICQKIVGRYGAELGGVGVWAGSTFRFTIPVLRKCSHERISDRAYRRQSRRCIVG